MRRQTPWLGPYDTSCLPSASSNSRRCTCSWRRAGASSRRHSGGRHACGSSPGCKRRGGPRPHSPSSRFGGTSHSPPVRPSSTPSLPHLGSRPGLRARCSRLACGQKPTSPDSPGHARTTPTSRSRARVAPTCSRECGRSRQMRRPSSPSHDRRSRHGSRTAKRSSHASRRRPIPIAWVAAAAGWAMVQAPDMRGYALMREAEAIARASSRPAAGRSGPG